MNDFLNYQNNFSPKRFWQKVKSVTTDASRDLIFSVLVLYYALQDPDLPGWARAKICGALGYFIFPVDAIPDWWPGGYADDASVIALALAAVAVHITGDIKDQARSKLRDWFGSGAADAGLVS